MTFYANSTLAHILEDLVLETARVGLLRPHESTGAKITLAFGAVAFLFLGLPLLWFIIWYTKNTRYVRQMKI